MRNAGRKSICWLGALLLVAGLAGSTQAGIGGWTFVRGDYDGSGAINLNDGIGLLNYLFIAGTPAPLCFDAADVNDDGVLSLGDAVYVLSFQFVPGSAPPPSPFPACGVDLTPDGFGCVGPLTGCGVATLPPDMQVAFAVDALEFNPGIRMHPNQAAITGLNFQELKFLMRPVTLQVGAVAGTVTVTQTTGTNLQLFQTNGTAIPFPAVFSVASLPTTFLVNATAVGEGVLSAVFSGGGVPEQVRFNVDRCSELAGGDLAGYPWFEYVRSINVNDEVLTAIDPIRYAERAGLNYRVYIVDHKTPAQWAANNTLTDVSGGFELDTVNGTSIQDNVVDAWLAGLDGGTSLGKPYDVVYDFGLNGTLDPGDLVDGLNYTEAGFYLVKDLTTNGPLATATPITYSGGTFLGQKTYFPSSIASLGQLPLVVISHGNGHNYVWYDYLGNHLASYGYIVMSHQNNTGPGIETASTTTLTNTDYILANQATIGGGVLNGHIDDTQITWIGHSRGGEGVARAFDRIFDGAYTPAQFVLGDIKIISSIAPTVFLGVTAANPHATNYHLIAGAADGDVNGGPDCDICQFFRIHQVGTGNTIATYLQGVGHNEFNCCGFADATGPSLIGRPAAQNVAKGYYIALLEYYIRNNIAAKDYLVRNFQGFKPQGIAANVIVANQYKDSSASGFPYIDDYQTQTSTGTSSSSTAVTFDVLNISEGVMNDNNTSFTWSTGDPMNGMTQASDGSDTSRGVVFDWTTGATRFYEVAVTAAQQNFSNYTFLKLRAAQGTRHPETVAVAGTLNFTVTLRDASGTTSSINFGSYGNITRPYQRTGVGTGAGWANEFNVVRLRVCDFENDGSGIDLTQIVAVRLEFGTGFGTSRGRIGIDDIRLTNE
ncbi:MAG: hypothetical protein ACKVX7_05720 [Planctomycetota bacterium]